MTLQRPTWLILREPGKVPERKGPFGYIPLADTLREFMAARPSALITVLTWENESAGPLVQDGPECLEMIDQRSASVARRHRASTRAAWADANGEIAPGGRQ
jgi:hypothetical protein